MFGNVLLYLTAVRAVEISAIVFTVIAHVFRKLPEHSHWRTLLRELSRAFLRCCQKLMDCDVILRNLSE